MSGLLTYYQSPEAMNLLGLSAGLLEAGGASQYPVGLGQGLGRGLLQGAQLGQSTANQQLRDAYLGAQTRYTDEQTKAQQAASAQAAALRQMMGGIASRFGQQQPQQPVMGQQNPMLPGHPGSSVMSAGAGGTDAPVQPSQPAQPMSPSGSGFPLTLEDVTLLKMMGGPDLTSAFTASQPRIESKDGVMYDRNSGQIVNTIPTVNQQGFSTQLVPMPGGGWQVVQVPGGAEAYGSQVRIGEQGRAGFDIVRVPDGRGGFVSMTRADAASRLGQRTPADGSVFQTTPFPAPRSASSGAAGRLGYERPETQRAGDTRFSEKVGGELGDIYGQLLRADLGAPNTIAKFERLGTLLGNVNTGKFTGTTTEIKAAAKSLGFDLTALGVRDDVVPAQAARALSNQVALELRNPGGGAGMPGALSDRDLTFLQQSIPGLENDPAAIPVMVEYRVKLAQREQQVAKMARAYKKRTGSFDEGFFDELAAWSDKNPLFTDADRNKAPGGGFRVLGVEGAR